MTEQFDQLDELIVTLGASVGRHEDRRSRCACRRCLSASSSACLPDQEATAGASEAIFGSASRQNSGGWAPDTQYLLSRKKNGTPLMPKLYPSSSSLVTALRLSSPVRACSTPFASSSHPLARLRRISVAPISNPSSK